MKESVRLKTWTTGTILIEGQHYTEAEQTPVNSRFSGQSALNSRNITTKLDTILLSVNRYILKVAQNSIVCS